MLHLIDYIKNTSGKQMKGGPVVHSSHLPISVAMSSSEAEYISAAAACTMRASHLQMFTNDL